MRSGFGVSISRHTARFLLVDIHFLKTFFYSKPGIRTVLAALLQKKVESQLAKGVILSDLLVKSLPYMQYFPVELIHFPVLCNPLEQDFFLWFAAFYLDNVALLKPINLLKVRNRIRILVCCNNYPKFLRKLFREPILDQIGLRMIVFFYLVYVFDDKDDLLPQNNTFLQPLIPEFQNSREFFPQLILLNRDGAV